LIVAKCDRCEQIIDKPDKMRRMTNIDANGTHWGREYHLCPGCEDSFGKWLKAFKRSETRPL
jgi:hypothetical protein